MQHSDTLTQPYLIRSQEDYVVLGPMQFGAPGLEAIEIVGPFVDIKALGPLITVHDSRIEPHLGIGHHPHRYNERIFYIMAGELDHSDRLNNITGHMATGDVGLFTEGMRGMVHSEWNNGDEVAHAFILVYATDPIPQRTSFTVLADADTTRYEEASGVQTRELVGPRSSLQVHGDVRLFTDSRLDHDASLDIALREEEGDLVSVQEGAARLGGQVVRQGGSVLFPPAADARRFRFEATEPARLLRVVHGPGFGLLRQ
jgi:redox-sensitive bicupin YhaK (pirin superfamily)